MATPLPGGGQGFFPKAPFGPPSSTSSSRNFEAFSIFLGSKTQLAVLASGSSVAAAAVAAEMRGVRKAGFWMLWPADFEADFEGEGFAGFI